MRTRKCWRGWVFATAFIICFHRVSVPGRGLVFLLSRRVSSHVQFYIVSLFLRKFLRQNMHFSHPACAVPVPVFVWYSGSTVLLSCLLRCVFQLLCLRCHVNSLTLLFWLSHRSVLSWIMRHAHNIFLSILPSLSFQSHSISRPSSPLHALSNIFLIASRASTQAKL